MKNPVASIASIIAITLFANNYALASGKADMHSLAQKIESAALDEMRTTGAPSLQISVGFGGNIIYEGAFGLADIENNVQATSESKYRTASIAKWFTATAAMRLAQDGIVDLDEPIQSYCPQYSQEHRVITPRQLLTHTSGIRHYLDYEEAVKSAGNSRKIQELKIKELEETLSSYTRHTDVISPLNTFKEDGLLFNPGTDWEYSSFGYRLLACVLQGAAKKTYVDLMESVVFEPARMIHTVPDDAWTIIHHRVTGYRIENGAIRRADLRDVSENLPAGGYLSTASDLVRFAIVFDNGLLSEETKGLMSSPLAADLDRDSDPSWRDAIPQRDKYGYGLMLFTKYSDGMVGHTGRQAGGSAVVVLAPDTDVSIAVMTNAKGWNGYLSFVMKIKEIVDSHIKNSQSFNKALQRTSR